MNIIKVKDIVKEFLELIPETRDSDTLLILKVWAKENPNLRDPLTSFISFSHDFLNGSHSSAGAITRARRKLQELHPELRGTNYKGRQQEQESVKDQLRQMG